VIQVVEKVVAFLSAVRVQSSQVQVLVVRGLKVNATLMADRVRDELNLTVDFVDFVGGRRVGLVVVSHFVVVSFSLFELLNYWLSLIESLPFEE
jgi:hypothetical protein